VQELRNFKTNERVTLAPHKTKYDSILRTHLTFARDDEIVAVKYRCAHET
jgi:hypothetical protein